MKTDMTPESLGKVIGTIIIVLTLFIVLPYLKLYGIPTGIIQYTSNKPVTTHTLTLTEEWSQELPVSIRAYPREDIWVEVCVVGGRREKRDITYLVPPESQRAQNWQAPATTGDALKFRLPRGSNSVKQAILVYHKK